MTNFEIKVGFGPENPRKGVLEVTFGTLAISVAGRPVTSFTSTSQPGSTVLELPLYYLAEWIAENWWAILWEPYKTEDSIQDDQDFVLRHSTIAAEHGFLLPDVVIGSGGRTVTITATPRTPRHTDVRFTEAAKVVLEREVVADILSRFVDGVCDRLYENDINDTHLSTCWNAVKETSEESIEYCQILGSLGLSPYADNGEIDVLIDRLHGILGSSFLRDLCLAARPDELERLGRVAMVANSVVNTAPELDLSRIINAPPPKDSISAPAWLRGRSAANSLRNRLSIKDDDEQGAEKVFDLIGFDPKRAARIGDNDFQPEGATIVGAVRRNDRKARIGCIQRHPAQRRFTAARGIFAAWSGAPNTGNLLTQAVTRQQQANRAFAAELLAPIKCLRKWSENQTLSHKKVTEIAEELNVAPDVVEKQAENNGLKVIKGMHHY